MKKNLPVIIAIIGVLILGVLVYIYRDRVPDEGWNMQSPEIAIIGKWQSANNSSFQREFDAYGGLHDRKGSMVTDGQWVPITVSEIPFSMPIEEGASYFRIYFGTGLNTEDNSYYKLSEITKTKLTLIDLKSGEYFEFSRIKK